MALIPDLPMSEAPEQQPVVETQQPAAEPGADFAVQVELLKAKNAELIGERRKDKEKFEALETRLNELQDRSNKQRQAKLAESGEHKALWEEAQKTVAQREAEIAELRAAMEQQSARAAEQQVRATATAAMAQKRRLCSGPALPADGLKTEDDRWQGRGNRWGRRGAVD